MPPHLQKRIALFYLLGIAQVFVGLYILIETPVVLTDDKKLGVLAFLFLGAAVDFWFPYQMKKKWLADQEKLRAAGASSDGASGTR